MRGRAGFFLALALCSVRGAYGAPSVNTSKGIVSGVLCGSATAAQFLGIPFAQPPVGSLRFKAPKPYGSSYPTEGLNATAYGAVCVQSDSSAAGSEDCLTLNVWAPATRPSTLLPVRVFLHGGGYQVGTGSDPVVNGCALVGDSDIVQVTLNYRLGVLGFLALPELRDEAAGGTTGNWGLLDQRLALQWVRDNIAAFGGDPARVTLTGQSAGAYSTILHSVMPGSAGLFSAVEPLSGSMDSMAVDFLGDAYYKGRRILSALNCSSRGFANASSCLAGVSAADLVAAKVAVQSSTRDDIIPVVDGVAVPKHPSLLMQDASVPAVPALFHVNRREGSLEVSGVVMPLLGPIPDLSTLTFEQIYGALSGAVPDGATALGILRSLVPVPEAFAERFHAQYNNATHGNFLEAAVAAQTDSAYLCTSRRAARAYVKKGAAVRFLISEFISPTSGCSAYFMGLPGLGIAYFLGAFHTYDLGQAYLAPFVIPGFGECPFTDGEKNASALLAGIGSTFSRTGSPLPPSSRIFQASATDVLRNLTSWPAWTTTSEPILSLDPANLTFANGTALDATCKLWDDMWDYMVARNTTYDAPPDPFIDTSLGRVYGTPCGSSATAVQYLGIPYAQPPVGALRFKAPRPITAKYPFAGLDAKAYGAACIPSDGSATGSEDCLTLNVWAPAAKPATPLPVRVFLHGGGYQVGSGTDPGNSGCPLIADSDVIHVTLNYRLGVLGFLALPELRDEAAGGTTGNWGLLDQRLALQWVRDNIAAFGGDPARVTLTGQSAGAMSTLLHTVMPGSAGLFSSVEALSASMDALAVDFTDDAFFKSRRILNALNCSARGYPNASSCLAAVPAAELVAAKVSFFRSVGDDIIPVVDGVAVPRHPSLLMQDASVPAFPALFHVNAREGAYEVTTTVAAFLGGSLPDPTTATVEEITAVLSAGVPDAAAALGVTRALVPIPESFVDRFLAQYNNATHGSFLEAAIAANTDNVYLCSSRRAARAYVKKGAAVRFLVNQFVEPSSSCSAYFMGLPGLGIAYFLGAFHTYDLYMAHMDPFRPGYDQCPWTLGERNLSAFRAGIGSAFSQTGAPLPPSSRIFQASGSAVLRNLTSWPAWTATSEPVLSLDPEAPSFLNGTAYDSTCKLWDDMWAFMVARNTTYDLLPPPPSPTPASPSPPPPTSSPPPPRHPPPPAPPITLPSNGVPTVYIAKDSTSTVASMAVTQTLEVPLSVGTDPTALAALFPGAVSAAWEATKAALPVEVTGSRNPSVQVQCTDAFLNVFRSELAARANVPLSALASAITCATLGLTPAAAAGRRRLGGRALLQANASATTNFTSAWAGTACARPTSANSTLALTVVLQTGADSTGVSQAAAYTASMTAALAAWGSTGGSSALAGLLVCAPAASRINTTAQVAVTTLVPLNADGLAMYGWACNRSESAIIGGGTCAIVQNGGAAAPPPPPDSGPSDDDSGPDTAIIIGASVAGAVAPLILLAIIAVIVMARRRRQKAPPAVAPAPGSNPFQQPPPGYQPQQQQPQAPGPGPPRAQSPGAQQQYAPGYKQMPAAYQPQPSAQQRSPMEAGMPPKATPMEHPASWGHGGGGGGVSGNYGYGSGGSPTTVYNNPIARH